MFQLEQFRMIYSHEGKVERTVQPMGKRYVFCPSDPPSEEGDAEEDPDKKKEDEDSSEEDKLDSEESSEEDDDRKMKKRRRPQQPPLHARPKKLRTAFSTYTLWCLDELAPASVPLNWRFFKQHTHTKEISQI
jgi:hypothetical protein